jgi:hypothetical protein
MAAVKISVNSHSLLNIHKKKITCIILMSDGSYYVRTKFIFLEGKGVVVLRLLKYIKMTLTSPNLEV